MLHWVPRGWNSQGSLSSARTLSRRSRTVVPASEVKDDLARLAARREELEALLAGTKEDPTLLHPKMAAHYRRQVANLAAVLDQEENRAAAADILRSLVDRIELTPNRHGKLAINLYGDVAGILTLAGNKGRPLDHSDPSVQQVKVVAGARNDLYRTRFYLARGRK
jgi:site-specific DNA recombinase